MIALNCDENRIVVLQTSRKIVSQTNTFLIATSFFKFQNYCDNESIFVIFATLNCVYFALQFCLHISKSYVIVDWNARCEKAVQITKNWTKRFRKQFRKHLNWRFDTNLTTSSFFKLQNYCDNESIFIIFTTLKCVYFVLQFELNRWKSYVIVDWCAKCEIIARFRNVLKWFWRMFRLKTWIKYWLNLSTLNNTNAKLIKIFLDRSFALNDFNEHFFIECVLYEFYNDKISISNQYNFNFK